MVTITQTSTVPWGVKKKELLSHAISFYYQLYFTVKVYLDKYEDKMKTEINLARSK